MGERRALVLGTFDLIHNEHLYFLNQAAQLGEVIVGLGTDRYQAGYKRNPVLTYSEREAFLDGLPMVSQVVPRDDVSIAPIIREWLREGDYLAAGGDWIGEPFLELSGIDVAFLMERRINLVFICSERAISTSDIIGRLTNAKG